LVAVPTDIPDRWKQLWSRRRDILLTLVVDGPMSGTELHDRIGGVDGRRADSEIYQDLTYLRDEGLVEMTSRDGRENDYAATGQGKVLVHRVGEEWAVVLHG
jgi:DNA-binding PadR family transcriptional regulator